MNNIPDTYSNGNELDRCARDFALLGEFGGRHRAEDIGHAERPYTRYTPRHAEDAS
jgi:hypothetical protein